MRFALLACVAVATCLTFSVDDADAFGGRGYARRQARRVHRHVHHAPVVVQRVHVAPVVSYRVPVYHHPPVSVQVGGHSSFYGSGYYGSAYRPYGHGVAVGVGW